MYIGYRSSSEGENFFAENAGRVPRHLTEKDKAAQGAGNIGARPSSTAATSRTTQLMFCMAVSVRLAR